MSARVNATPPIPYLVCVSWFSRSGEPAARVWVGGLGKLSLQTKGSFRFAGTRRFETRGLVTCRRKQPNCLNLGINSWIAYAAMDHSLYNIQYRLINRISVDQRNHRPRCLTPSIPFWTTRSASSRRSELHSRTPGPVRIGRWGGDIVVGAVHHHHQLYVPRRRRQQLSEHFLRPYS